MPLWTCMTDRGSLYSVAPGPPSRQSSVSLHLGQLASLLELTLHRNEWVPFLPASLYFSTSFSFMLCFSFKDSLTPQRQPSYSSESLQSFLLESSLILGPSCQNRHKSKQLKEPDARPIQSKGRLEKRQLRCNHTKLSASDEKWGISGMHLSFFFLVLPASVLVIAWTLSVSVDVACVGAHAGLRFGVLDGGDAGMKIMTRHNARELTAAATPLLVRVKNPAWTVTPTPAPVTPTPLQPSFKGLPL